MIEPGEDIDASDFIDTSAGAADAGKIPKLNSDGQLDGSFFKQPDVVTFTASGTWTKPAGLVYVVVELVGGGAAGDKATGNPDPRSGGSGAGYARKLIAADDLGATEAVSIGTGGIADPPADGGTTSFGSHFSATGGAHTAGTPGTGFGGDINIIGERGQPATTDSGRGGDSFLGRGGVPVTSFGGNAGTGYGAGGSGGKAASATDQPGGPGTDGICIVTQHYE